MPVIGEVNPDSLEDAKEILIYCPAALPLDYDLKPPLLLVVGDLETEGDFVFASGQRLQIILLPFEFLEL